MSTIRPPAFREIRFDANRLRDDRREEVIAWVKSLGVEPKDVRPEGLIRQGQQNYELHLSKFVRGEDGKLRLDHAQNRVVTEPLVIQLETKLYPEGTWPSCLGVES